MGVFISLAARSTEPKMMLLARNSMGAHTMAKYTAASRRISGSAPSQAGKNGEIAKVATPSAAPSATVKYSAWAEAVRARS